MAIVFVRNAFNCLHLLGRIIFRSPLCFHNQCNTFNCLLLLVIAGKCGHTLFSFHWTNIPRGIVSILNVISSTDNFAKETAKLSVGTTDLTKSGAKVLQYRFHSRQNKLKRSYNSPFLALTRSYNPLNALNALKIHLMHLKVGVHSRKNKLICS